MGSGDTVKDSKKNTKPIEKTPQNSRLSSSSTETKDPEPATSQVQPVVVKQEESTFEIIPTNYPEDTSPDYAGQTTHGGEYSHYSSNSSVDSQLRYQPSGYSSDRAGGGVGSASYRTPYAARPPPATGLTSEQLLNVQRNMEHCAQQHRQQMENVIRNNNEATQFLSRGQLIVRMRGLPYDCSAKQVVDFFEAGEYGIKLHESEDGVLFVRKPDGRATGDAFVMLSNEADVDKALKKHRESIGSRYIELFRSSPAEVMNRSMDLRHMEQPPQQQPLPPLIAQLPPLPPMLAQQSVAHGPRKDCVRLRGLPFEAQIEHVLEFLGEFAKNIMFRGVHMVYTPQGQPSGEAFIQMVSEHAAWSCTQHRHNRYMYFGKKNRYIEVFQCSGDDMNCVLAGAGATNPMAIAAPPPTAPGPRSIVPTAGGSPMLSPYGAYPLGPAPAVLSHALSAGPRLSPYPTAMAPTYTMYYWPYPSPPVSPTGGYYSSMPHTIIPTECIPMHPTGELAMHSGEAVATM